MGRSPFVRYVLLEIPGWILGGVVLAVFVHLDEISRRTAALLLALWVAKDFALYPLLRVGYMPSAPDGSGTLIGAIGTARDRLDPTGWVRVGSELWQAELARESAPVEAGGRVRVLSVRGLTLRVEAA
jgi:membrane-bound ClpP family serine protease